MKEDDIVQHFDLQPHPEGGWYRQTWQANNAGRAAGTAILFLLKKGEKSHWHTVDAVEIWHFHAGSPLTLKTAETDEGPAMQHRLGPDFQNGHVPQVIVPKDHWQAAEADAGWSLVGCTVSPGFEFSGFQLAPKGFDIGID